MSANIQLFYYTGPYTSTLLPTAEALLVRLNAVRKQRYEQRKVEKQRALDLAALRLLEIGMQSAGHGGFALSDVEYPSQAGIAGKPQWGDGSIDFNISHASAIAACAIAAGCKVGLDVEANREFNPRTVLRLVADGASIAHAMDASNALARWTQIEAVLKGAGLGVMNAREIVWAGEVVLLRGERWWVHGIDCGHAHVAHIAVNVPDVTLSVRQVAEV